MDQWIVEEKAVITDEVLAIADEEIKYQISQAVHFVADVGDGVDPYKLVGRVKEIASLEEMNAEHYMDSVLVEDSAYEVVPGFTGEPVIKIDSKPKGGDISGAFLNQAKGEDKGESEDRELLAKFLLDNL